MRRTKDEGRRTKEGRCSSFILRTTSLVLLLAAGGCASTWDEITSRDFHFKDVFKAKPDPLVEAETSPDGDHRFRALRRLEEPLEHGGDPQQQDRVVSLLIKRATTDPQPLCRMAAINTMRRFHDPRIVPGLINAYYAASPSPPSTARGLADSSPVSLTPEIATAIRCQALAALGESGRAEALDLLLVVLRAPPSVGAVADKQLSMDERIAAARALGHFKQYQATEALVGVLRTDQDIALRNRANESLQAITGKDFPPEAQPWGDFFHRAPPEEAFAGPNFVDRAIRLISFQSP